MALPDLLGLSAIAPGEVSGLGDISSRIIVRLCHNGPTVSSTSFVGPLSVLLQNVRRFTACPLFAELFLIAACNLLLFANNSIWFHFPGPQAVQRAQQSRRRMVGSDRIGPPLCAAHTHLDRILCDFLRVRSNFQIIS